jgi:hypothetical protein
LTEFIGPVQTTAVIVNFRTADKAVTAVRSLQASNPPVASIIVVDNGSGDDSARRIASSVDGIRLIEEPTNRGFSAACNVGIRLALQLGASRILLLNPDATISRSAVATMARLLDDEPIGIVGPIVVSKTEPKQIESSGIRYSQTTGRMWNLDFGRLLSSTARAERRMVDAVSGCAMLIKGQVFEETGLLDEDYFFGFEDIDFCLRARAKGFLSAVAGGAIVEHEGQAAIGKGSSRRMYFATRNHLLLAERSSPAQSRAARYFRVLSVLSLNLGNALTTSEVSRLDALRGFASGVRDYLRGCKDLRM